MLEFNYVHTVVSSIIAVVVVDEMSCVWSVDKVVVRDKTDGGRFKSVHCEIATNITVLA